MAIAQGFAAGSSGFDFDPVRALGAGAQVTTLQRQADLMQFQLQRQKKRAELEDQFLDMISQELNAAKAAELDAIREEVRVAQDAGVRQALDQDRGFAFMDPAEAMYQELNPYAPRTGPQIPGPLQMTAPTVTGDLDADLSALEPSPPDRLRELDEALGERPFGGHSGVLDKARRRLESARRIAASASASERDKAKALRQIDYLEGQIPLLEERAAMERERFDLRLDWLGPPPEQTRFPGARDFLY